MDVGSHPFILEPLHENDPVVFYLILGGLALLPLASTDFDIPVHENEG